VDFFEAASARSDHIATASASAAIQPARWLPKHPAPVLLRWLAERGSTYRAKYRGLVLLGESRLGVHRADATSRSTRVLDADEQDQPRSGTQSRGRGKLGRGRAVGSDSLESALNILTSVLGSSHSQVDR